MPRTTLCHALLAAVAMIYGGFLAPEAHASSIPNWLQKHIGLSDGQIAVNILIFVRRRPSSQKKIKALFQNLTCCCRMGVKDVQTSIAVRRSSYNSQVLETSMQAEVSQAIVPSEASSSHNNYDKSVNLESYEADA